MVLAEPNIIYKYSELNKVDASDKIKSLASFDELMNYLISIEAIIWFNGWAVYADDLRADYKNGELYFPVYMYDTVDDIQYNHRLEKIVIHSFENGYNIEGIVVQEHIGKPEICTVSIKDKEFMRELTEKDLDAKDIFMRYIASSYGYHINEVSAFKYNKVALSNLKSKQREKLKDSGLDFYGTYLDMEYRDVRNWKLEELIEKFSSDELKMELPFSIRRLQFELELYIRIYKDIGWNNWSCTVLDRHKDRSNAFWKYKLNSIYFICKQNWFKGKLKNK